MSRYQQVVGDFFPETADGSTGILCRITTNDPGTLGLELTLSNLDPESMESVSAIGTFTVEP